MNVRVGDIIKLENNQFVAVSKLTFFFYFVAENSKALTVKDFFWEIQKLLKAVAGSVVQRLIYCPFFHH